MAADPLRYVVDQPLFIVPSVLARLRDYRAGDKLDLLPGLDTGAERERLCAELDRLADRLLTGVAQHPTKLWVLQQFRVSLEAVEQEDTEAREHFGAELERLMDILGIGSSDGLLAHYLGGI